MGFGNQPIETRHIASLRRQGEGFHQVIWGEGNGGRAHALLLNALGGDR